MSETKYTNRLAESLSPYLRQHSTNPVDWYPWGEEAFERARQEMKLIFLSIGYAACHWCHVMEEESFRNETIAEILNRHFISVKVDREERPDVDACYIEAVQQMTGHAGWPLSVFLLPDLRPVFGGTYFPPEDRFGRPGFRRILETLARTWEEDPVQLITRAEQITRRIYRAAAAPEPSEEALSPELLEQAGAYFSSIFDPTHGGFGPAPKFPQPPTLEWLLHEAFRTQLPVYRDMALLTLERMAAGGIYDHLGGGFHRYATDAAWTVPHFEKMLYDSALLARTYLQAYQMTGDAAFRSVAEDILRFLIRDMRGEEGGFYSSMDADSEGEEGKHYVWTAEELRTLLSPKDWQVLEHLFHLPERGNWEGSLILTRRQPITEAPDATDWEALRARLLRHRQERVTPPAIDDKRLLAWNAMAVEAFIEAYRVTGEATYLETARQTLEHLFSQHRTGTGDWLRVYREGQAYQPAFLEDYAYLSRALLHMAETTGEPRWLHEAGAVIETMLSRFYDADTGTFFLTEAHTELPIRQRSETDLPYPSAQAVALEVLHRASLLLQRPEWRAIVVQTLSRMIPQLRRFPGAYPHHLQLVSRLFTDEQVLVVVGPEPEPFLREIYRHYHPSRSVLRAEAFPEHPLVKGKHLPEGQTGVFLCEGETCEAPILDVETLRMRLQRS